MESVIARFEQMHETMIQTVTPSNAFFANTFEPWARVSNETEADTGMIQLLGYVAADKETRDAADKAQRLLGFAHAAWMARSDLFVLLKAAAERDETLDPESRHWMEAKLRDFTTCGHGSLDESTMHAYIRQLSEIENLKYRYNRNLMKESGGLWMDRKDLDGVPENELQTWKRDGRVNEGKYFVPFANGGAKIVLSYACKESARRKMFLAEEAKVPENVKLLQEITCLRDAQARLLGYKSHGQFRIQGRAIKSVDSVQKLLEELRESLVPLGRLELAELQRLRMESLKRHDPLECSENDRLPPWDLAYYKRLRSLAASVDEEAISEYFPLGPTVTGMLVIFEPILMLRFVKIPQNELDRNSIWHESVEVWEAWDTEGTDFLGFLYFDLLWREDKYKGSQNANIHCGFLKQDGTRKVPATALMCCFPQPTESTCALLKHSEVVILFHELGHAIHDLVSKTKFARFHGTGLPVDFGEMPSILLENWCWMEETLSKLSCHYTTLDPRYLDEWRARHVGAPDPPAKIPSDLSKRLINTRYLNHGLYYLHQLSVSIFDMKIHNPAGPGDIASLELTKLWYDIREDIEGMDFTESRKKGHGHVTFGHLLSGYDMGYFGYLR
ncbi:metallopeptidase MepB [Purpureocillium lilacinum]|uniref:Metallopeptidase MepB n=1 Tax=Purpureocillium lilacinum TaxID=33203 RepID=A0A179GP70_PURLI|nr:metallopeptidase MepB [Purpureocillium lilacinum]